MQYELGSGWMTARPSCQDNNNHTIESAVICRGGRDGDKEWKSAAGSTPKSTVDITSLAWTASGCRPIATVLSQHFPGHVQPQVLPSVSGNQLFVFRLPLFFSFFHLLSPHHCQSFIFCVARTLCFISIHLQELGSAACRRSVMASNSTDNRATPQGGILEGGNPSHYDPKNPIVVFIIQVRV